jgi:predicted ribosome quality control (RQC) complex YloA/Tae2 family protein
MKSPSGLEVLVGKNARENEHMSTQLLAGNDYWFHAKGVPGPHVILKVPKGITPTALDISFASKFAGTCVTVVRGINVYKVKGDALGTVRYNLL